MEVHILRISGSTPALYPNRKEAVELFHVSSRKQRYLRGKDRSKTGTQDRSKRQGSETMGNGIDQGHLLGNP